MTTRLLPPKTFRRPAPATRRRRGARWPAYRSRRGVALVLTLLLTGALTALALCAIALSSSSSLITKYYDGERDYRYAAEAGLALGRARLAKDPSLILPDSGYLTLIPTTQLFDAAGRAVPRTQVVVYAGRSGNVTNQFGVFATLVARAEDGAGTRHVRRLELVAENFARFAMFTDTWQSGLCYGTGEYIRGLAWSNGDWVSCGSPEYSDSVGAVGSVTGGNPTFKKGAGSVRSGQSAIPLPSAAQLSKLPAYAATGNLNFALTPGRAMMRVEFVPVDLDRTGGATGVNEGFIRVFETYTLPATPTMTGLALGMERGRAAGWWAPTSSGDRTSVKMPPAFADSLCGDVHNGGKFFPVAVHTQSWYPGRAFTGATPASERDNVGAIDSVARQRILGNAGARCYPAGDPHLVAVERLSGSNQIGGEDTTFTAAGRWGTWRSYPGTVASIVSNARPDARYLFPLSKSLNPGFKGVVYTSDNVWIGGQLRGRVTFYGAQDVRFVDDLTYVTIPSAPSRDCQDADQLDILGIISGRNVMIDSNAINRPQRFRAAASSTVNPGDYKFLSSNQDFFLHGVAMALTGTFGVDGYDTGPYSVRTCSGIGTSGGCIAQTGGVIQKFISATFDGSSSGFAENRESDKCMSEVSPPYFPITGRYFGNRYYESDPVRFDVDRLFRGLQSLGAGQ